MEEVIKIVIVHQKRLLREGLTRVLSQQNGMTVVASVTEIHESLEEVAKLRPDIAIIDLSLPERQGLREAHQLCMACPEVKILIIGLTELESDVLSCIEAGAAGYISQEASLEEFFTNIQAIVKGEAICSPKVTGFLFSWIAEAAHQRERLLDLGLIHITRREREIIMLIEKGLSNKEIAVCLKIEVKTVKNHVHNILEKLQLNNRQEMARYAREQGIVGLDHGVGHPNNSCP